MVLLATFFGGGCGCRWQEQFTAPRSVFDFFLVVKDGKFVLKDFETSRLEQPFLIAFFVGLSIKVPF